MTSHLFDEQHFLFDEHHFLFDEYTNLIDESFQRYFMNRYNLLIKVILTILKVLTHTFRLIEGSDHFFDIPVKGIPNGK